METIHYVRALGRSWFIILITLLAGGAGGYYVYHSATPLYQSSVNMVVSGGSSDGVGGEIANRTVATQRALALSQVASTVPAVNAAKRAAGFPAANPTVTSTASTTGPFLTVVVTDTSAAEASAIAAKFASTLPVTLAKLEEIQETIKVSNLAPPTTPTDPISPSLLRDLGLGLAAGAVLGLALAFVRETVNRSIRESDELEDLTGLPILGTVPRDLPKKLLPAVSDPRSPRAEAYRQVRTSLLNGSSARPLTIAVTSAAQGEGKTSVAANLAAVFSRAGHRVALVDADLRRPRVAKFFDLPRGAGLSEVLAGAERLEDAVTALDGGRLAVLPSGRVAANPSEALGSTEMKNVLSRLAEHYEFIIIDTPPVLPVTDALVLAPYVDGVLLVARLGHTTRERVKHAASALARANATVIGAVPNQAGNGSDRDYRYSYSYKGARRVSRGKGDDGLAVPVSRDSVSPPPRSSDAVAGTGRHADVADDDTMQFGFEGFGFREGSERSGPPDTDRRSGRRRRRR